MKKLLILFLVFIMALGLAACGEKAPEVNENAVPTITVDAAKSVQFEVGDAEPDWKTYFTITDENDGDIEVTDDMITENVDMSAKGAYQVTIEIENSVLNYDSKTLDITVGGATVVADVVADFDAGIFDNSYTFENMLIIGANFDPDSALAFAIDSEYRAVTLDLYEHPQLSTLKIGDVISFSASQSDYAKEDYHMVLIPGDITVDAGSSITFDKSKCVSITHDELAALQAEGSFDNYTKCYNVTDGGVYDGYDHLTPNGDYTFAWETFSNAFDDMLDNMFAKMDFVGIKLGDNGRVVYVSVDNFNMNNQESAEALLTRGILLDNESLDQINGDLDLFTSYGDFTIEWTSSDEAVIANDGKFTRPAADSAEVTLTAVVKSSDVNFTHTVDVTALGELPATAIYDITQTSEDGDLVKIEGTVVATNGADNFAVYDGTDFVLVDAYGTPVEGEVAALAVGDTVSVTATVNMSYSTDYWLSLYPTAMTVTPSAGVLELTTTPVAGADIEDALGLGGMVMLYELTGTYDDAAYTIDGLEVYQYGPQLDGAGDYTVKFFVYRDKADAPAEIYLVDVIPAS